MAFALAGCGGRRPARAPEAEPPKPKAMVTGTAKGLTLTEADRQGRKLYVIRSKATAISELKADATLSDAQITLYEAGVPNVVIVAPRTRVDAKSKDVVMWGGLSARAPSQGASFRVDRLTWNAGTKLFRGEGHVTYRNGPATFWADHMTGSTPVKKVHLGESVRFRIEPTRK
ncbi:MAG TPA: LPS export ABC transporter periplasmic protein LptC [Armatimonadota bacterium]|jgi:LPS export ABC transporter protein LptC